jgi:hypothetical protein
MTGQIEIGCRCGKVQLALSGAPITVAECYCGSCRDAAARIGTLPGAPEVVGDHGSTHFVLYRKDRVQIVKGREWLRNFRLSPQAQTRRVIASCCNTPVLVEFKGGHWVSLFGNLWHGQALPPAKLRTQTGDYRGEQPLDAAVPSGGWETAKFYGKLLGAWAAMGFKASPVALDTPEIEVRR